MLVLYTTVHYRTILRVSIIIKTIYGFLTHFVSFFNWSWLVILILFQIPYSFKNCLEFSGVYKPKPRVWGSKSSQREVENYVIFFLTERATMRWNIFKRSTVVTMRLFFLQIGVNNSELKKKLPYVMRDKMKLLWTE